MRRWTKEEEELLSSLNYQYIEKNCLVKKFNRSAISIYKKCKRDKIKIYVIKHSHNQWTSQEDQTLCELFSTENKEKICSLLKNRTWENIVRRAKKLGLIERKKKRWSKSEDDFLIEHYYNSEIDFMMNELKRSWIAIKTRAQLLNLKRSSEFTRDSDLSILLNNSFESLYWIGFILADGHIDLNVYRLIICLSIKDKDHLDKFRKYVTKSRLWINEYSNKVTVSIQDKDNVKMISEIYDISNLKTYNPPSISIFEKMNDDEFLCMLAGFIDGDGSIQYQYGRTDCKLTIKLHASWKELLEYFKYRLNNIFPNFNITVKINNFGYLELRISNNLLLNEIKRKLETLNIPLLSRKWDKINLARNNRYVSLQKRREKILLEYDSGATSSDLIKKYSISNSGLWKILKKYRS